ncbi:MAG: prepilin peptidase [Hyphomicrobiales bacterium]|nr:prepilin peptidase [Hyphomicrobiales bacterium]
MRYAAFSILAMLLVAVAIIDMRRMIIPNALNLAIAITGLAASYATGLPEMWSALAGMAAGGLLLGLVRLQFRLRRGFHGLGLGDVKFAAAAGAWTGLEDLAPALFCGSLFCLLFLLAKWNQGATIDSSQKIPFGPFLALGAGTIAAWHAVAAAPLTETLATILSGT